MGAASRLTVNNNINASASAMQMAHHTLGDGGIAAASIKPLSLSLPLPLSGRHQTVISEGVGLQAGQGYGPAARRLLRRFEAQALCPDQRAA